MAWNIRYEILLTEEHWEDLVRDNRMNFFPDNMPDLRLRKLCCSTSLSMNTLDPRGRQSGVLSYFCCRMRQARLHAAIIARSSRHANIMTPAWGSVQLISSLVVYLALNPGPSDHAKSSGRHQFAISYVLRRIKCGGDAVMRGGGDLLIFTLTPSRS